MEFENSEGEIEDEEGAVLGSALNPVTQTYLTYGDYEGHILYLYDAATNSWSTETLPFEEEEGVNDGGMAYVGLPGGIEGTYMIQGQGGTEFARWTERYETDLARRCRRALLPMPPAETSPTRSRSRTTVQIRRTR